MENLKGFDFSNYSFPAANSAKESKHSTPDSKNSNELMKQPGQLLGKVVKDAKICWVNKFAGLVLKLKSESKKTAYAFVHVSFIGRFDSRVIMSEF